MLASLTHRQKLILLVAWLGWVFDVMEASLFGIVKTSLLMELMGPEASAASGSKVGSAIHVAMITGWAIGGFVFGIVADRWGRTRTLILTVAWYCLFTGLTALAQTTDQVMGLRFLTGLGIGGEWAAGAALIAETMPDSFRPRAAAILQTAAAIGSALGAVLTLTIGQADWRPVFIAGIFPALLCLSLRWRLESDERPRALKSEPASTGPRAWLSPVANLVRTRPYGGRLAVAVTIGVVGIFGGGLLPFWMADLIRPHVVGTPDEVKQIVPKLTAYGTIIMHVGTFAGVMLFPRLTERIGHKRAFTLFFLLAGLTLASVGPIGQSIPLIWVWSALVCFFALGLTSGFALFFPELFRADFRATGTGIAYNSGRLLQIPFILLIGDLVKGGGFAISAVISVFAVMYLIPIVAIRFAPETSGKPLGEG